MQDGVEHSTEVFHQSCVMCFQMGCRFRIYAQSSKSDVKFLNGIIVIPGSKYKQMDMTDKKKTTG